MARVELRVSGSPLSHGSPSTWPEVQSTPAAMNRVKEVERINKKDLELQLHADTVGDPGKWDVDKSWHAQYKHSAYVYVGGLPYDLSEGDVIVIFSQFGEIVDVNLPRDKDTGKPKGFAFIAYEDQRSTVLAVDNFNGAKVLGRTLRCDHCNSFREEQKKDAANLPDHVTRKLNDAELAKKKEDIERRNAELEDAANAKGELFAHARGTAEDDQQRDERDIRQSITQNRDAAASAKRTSHIESVLARRKHDYEREANYEAQQQQRREERKREREREIEREREAAQSGGAPPPPPLALAAALPGPAAPEMEKAESRFDRMMNGGGSKKKKKHKTKHAAPDEVRPSAPEASGERRPGDGISVDETNALRESIGLKPLRK